MTTIELFKPTIKDKKGKMLHPKREYERGQQAPEPKLLLGCRGTVT